MRNYKQVYAIKKGYENSIRKVCPDINNEPGIYIFYRTNEEDFTFCYCGQSVKILDRCISHFMEYDHIALSLKKWKLYDKDKNPYGWKLKFKNYPREELDEAEKSTIKNCAKMGWQLYNTTSGSQSNTKGQLKEYKSPKNYHQGLEQGYINASKEISHLFDLHLNVSTKKDVPTTNQKKALEKFNEFLNYHKKDKE